MNPNCYSLYDEWHVSKGRICHTDAHACHTHAQKCGTLVFPRRAPRHGNGRPGCSVTQYTKLNIPADKLLQCISWYIACDGMAGGKRQEKGYPLITLPWVING